MSIVSHIIEHDKLGFYAAGPTTLTVGATGRFKTLQAAFDYIATQPAFVAETINTNGAVNSWVQGTSVMTCSTVPHTAPGSFLPGWGRGRIWFKLTGDSYYYPLDCISGVAVGTGVELSSTMRRIEATIAAPTAITWYSENEFIIELLEDSYTAGPLDITSDCCVTIVGTGRTLVQTVFRNQSSALKSGRLTFVGCTIGKPTGISSTFSGFPDANTLVCEIFDSRIAQPHSDFMYPNNYFGSVRVSNTELFQNPVDQQGHVFSSYCQGDLVIDNLIWDLASWSSLDGDLYGNLTAFLIDPGVTRSPHRIIVNNLNAYIRDPFGDMAGANGGHIAVVGGASGFANSEVIVNGVNLVVLGTTTANISIAKLINTSVGNTIHIDDAKVYAPGCSGAIKLVSSAALNSASMVSIGRSNTVHDCDTAANLTYTVKQAQAAGTATVANTTTSIAVTHGLGYTPRIEDINIVPTLLGNAAKWWVTAVGATTFTINVDADPGASTATFAWRIGV